jgi:YD repeat-containing protein
VPNVVLPKTIGRTYDSLERDYLSDFGYGWSLAIGSPRLEVASDSNVTLTLPDGRRRTFYFAPIPYSPLFGNLSEPNYQGEPGEYGKLSTTNSCSLVVPGAGAFYCFLGGAGALYNQNVEKYHYQDPYGRVFTFSPAGKLERIRDLNGNELNFTPDGIISSSGANVLFNRDAQGRITTVTPPDGSVYTYEYDANGDLVAVHLPDTAEPIEYSYYRTRPASFPERRLRCPQ